MSMVDLQDIKLKEVMVTRPFTIGIDEPFSRVWEIFRLHGVRHLPVLDNKRRLKGLITLRDLYRIISPRKAADGNFIYNKDELDRYILKNVMTKEVVTRSPDDSLADVVEAMVRTKFGCIPIINQDNYLVGIITHIDVLRKIVQLS